jgi:hypothetical protein
MYRIGKIKERNTRNKRKSYTRFPFPGSPCFISGNRCVILEKSKKVSIHVVVGIDVSGIT